MLLIMNATQPRIPPKLRDALNTAGQVNCCWESIAMLLDTGASLHGIWTTLQREKMLTCGYDAFRRAVKHRRSRDAQPRRPAATQPKPHAPIQPAETTLMTPKEEPSERGSRQGSAPRVFKPNPTPDLDSLF